MREKRTGGLPYVLLNLLLAFIGVAAFINSAAVVENAYAAENETYQWTMQVVGIDELPGQEWSPTWDMLIDGPDPNDGYWRWLFESSYPRYEGFTCVAVECIPDKMTVRCTYEENDTEWLLVMTGLPGGAEKKRKFELPASVVPGEMNGVGNTSTIPWDDAPDGCIGPKLDKVDEATRTVYVSYEQVATVQVEYIGYDDTGNTEEVAPTQELGWMFSSTGFRNGELLRGDDGKYIDPYDPSASALPQYLNYPDESWAYSHCESWGYGTHGKLVLYFSKVQQIADSVEFYFYGITGYETAYEADEDGWQEYERPIVEEIAASAFHDDLTEDDGLYCGEFLYDDDDEMIIQKFAEPIPGWKYSYCEIDSDTTPARVCFYYEKADEEKGDEWYDDGVCTYSFFYWDEDGNLLRDEDCINTAGNVHEVYGVDDYPKFDGYTFLRLEPDKTSPKWCFHVIYRKVQPAPDPHDPTSSEADDPIQSDSTLEKELPNTGSIENTPEQESTVPKFTTLVVKDKAEALNAPAEENIAEDETPMTELPATGDSSPIVLIVYALIPAMIGLTAGRRRILGTFAE